jgi:outer membrane lipoprotein-sorting protein
VNPTESKRIALIALIALAVASTASWAQSPDPAAALKTADEIMYPPSFSLTLSISTAKPGKDSTSMEIEVSHKENMGTFMEILSPARTKGTRFLQTNDALWMFSPKSGSRSALRLSPRESFQGSALSNNDVGDSSWSNDYVTSLAGSETISSADFGEVEAWKIVGKAARKDVPYGEVRMYQRKGDLLPLKIEYFAKSGLPLKAMELSGYATAAGRLRPHRLVITMDDGTGEKSVVVISDLRARDDLPDAMFNQSWLTR